MEDFICELKKSWGLLDCNEVRMGDGADFCFLSEYTDGYPPYPP